MTNKIAILRVIRNNTIERIFLVDVYLDTRTQFQNVHLRSNAKVFEVTSEGNQNEITLLDLEKVTKLDTESLLTIFKYRDIEDAMDLPKRSLVSNEDYVPAFNLMLDENKVDVSIEDVAKEVEEPDVLEYGKRFLFHKTFKAKEKTERIYFGGKYNKGNDFKDDYRYEITKGRFLDQTYKDGINLDNGIVYGGAYYFTIDNLNTEEIVDEDMRLIREADTFVAVFDDRQSMSTVAELLYAVQLNKRIVIFSKRNEKVKYTPQTNVWFIYNMLKKLCKPFEFHLYDGELSGAQIMNLVGGR